METAVSKLLSILHTPVAAMFMIYIIKISE